MAKLFFSVISFALGSFVLRLFTALGIGLFTYHGLMALIDSFVSYLKPLFDGLPLSILQLFTIAGVFEGMSIVISALLTRTAINSAKTFLGTFSR